MASPSSRALKFLSTLERRKALPTKTVEQIIRDTGFPCFQVWLDFHERYAGYVEKFGRDSAQWGLAHSSTQWHAPNAVDMDREPNEETWMISCADAHPSYSYRLTNTGEFIGAPAENFTVHVERIALGWEFEQLGKSQVLDSKGIRSFVEAKVFEKEVQSFKVTEASDSFTNYYMSEKYLVVEEAKTKTLRRVRFLSQK